MAQYKNKSELSVVEESTTEAIEEKENSEIASPPVFRGYKWELTAGSHTQADKTVINRGDSFYHSARSNSELPFWAKNRARLILG